MRFGEILPKTLLLLGLSLRDRLAEQNRVFSLRPCVLAVKKQTAKAQGFFTMHSPSESPNYA
jgi:hypothetical protein